MANDSKQNRRMTNGLVALSSVAVLSIYGAGYFKTRAAAERLEGEGARRRTAAPVAVVAASSPSPAEPVIGPAPPAAEPDAVVAAVPHLEAVAPPAEPAPAPATDTKSIDPPAAPPTPAVATAVPAMPPAEPAAIVAAAPAAPAIEPIAPIAPVVDPVAPDQQAPESADVEAAAAKPGDAVPVTYKDGMYLGWGSCRHGQIQARVVVRDGRIASASIAKCLTRYNCSWIAPIVPQVVERQSPEVDYVTGATESADAFYYAVVAALDQAK